MMFDLLGGLGIVLVSRLVLSGLRSLGGWFDRKRSDREAKSSLVAADAAWRTVTTPRERALEAAADQGVGLVYYRHGVAPPELAALIRSGVVSVEELVACFESALREELENPLD